MISAIESSQAPVAPPDEEWRVVPDFPDYEVSSLGQVRRATASSGTKVGRMLRPFSRDSITYIGIYDRHGKTTTPRVDTLLAHAFLGPCPPGCVVGHKDGNRSNITLENIAYMPVAEMRERLGRFRKAELAKQGIDPKESEGSHKGTPRLAKAMVPAPAGPVQLPATFMKPATPAPPGPVTISASAVPQYLTGWAPTAYRKVVADGLLIIDVYQETGGWQVTILGATEKHLHIGEVSHDEAMKQANDVLARLFGDLIAVKMAGRGV